MREHRTFLLLLLIMAVFSLSGTGTTIVILYSAAFEEQKARLIETAQSQARLIEAIARFDAVFSEEDYPGGAEAATLSQIIDAHRQYRGFGETGEFTLARREGDSIDFILSHRHFDLENPKPVAFDSDLAEPMRQALQGESGVLIGTDYRGETVLAAYEPVAELNLGIVAKIDLREIRHPYVLAGWVAAGISILIIMACAFLFFRIINPVIHRITRSEASLAKAQRIAHLGNWDWNIVTNELLWSDEIYRIFGLAPQEFGATYEAFLRSVHPEDRDQVKKAVNEAAYDKNPYSIDHRIVLPDGSERTVHEQAELTFDINGRPTRMVGTVQDITEQKLAWEAFRKAEAKYRSIVENAPYGIYLSTAEGSFLDVNPALVTMLGYDSAEELLSTDANTDIYSDPEELIRLIEQYQRHEYINGVETQWKRKDSSLLTVRLGGRIVRNQQGEIELFEVIVEDITERKSLEQQLRWAQKMEAVGELAGGVAHDFNNLLTTIYGYSDLLLERLEEGDPLRESAGEIKKAGQRGAALTQQLLAFSRKQVLRPEALDLYAVVVDMKKMLQRLIGEDIDIILTSDPERASVKADRTQIEQIIMNLVINARDAMPRGGKLTIETANVFLDEEYVRRHMPIEPGFYVMLAVSDTGCGMDEARQARIFEPFYTTKEQGKGTGLGLSTVYGIVKQSRGYVWVYSEPGQGTTFKIYLPQTEETAELPHQEVTLPEVPKGSETVLLVEDDEAVRSYARQVLQENGYTVLEASNGDEALLVCDRHKLPIHLLLTDVVMPGISGPDLHDRVASMHSKMRVLYMSGYAENAIVHHGVLDPGVDLLQKPFSMRGLLCKVREVLSAPHAARNRG